MPVCSYCAGEDFVVLDGCYFCALCNTQSQDYFEVEGNDEYHEGGLSGRLKVRTRASKSNTKDYGMQWTTYDAFNLIIKSQVDALISLGASPELKTVVLQLWANYLTILRVCCNGQKVMTNLRKRDYCVLYTSCGKISRDNSHLRKRYRKKGKVKHRKPSLENEPLTIKPPRKSRKLRFDLVSEPENEEAADSNDSDSRTISNAKVKSRKTVTHRNIWKTRHLRKITDTINRMTLSKTIHFVYLGLLILNEKILLCDLIRWTWEGLIPYYQAATEVLPDEMLFQASDNHTFRAMYPLNHEFISMETARLAQFLKIKRIPSKPLQCLTSRFIKELDLPAEMHCYVNNLINIYPPRMKWECSIKGKMCYRIPNYEGRAISYIMLALKLLFGLNDVDEWKKSKLASEIKEENSSQLLGGKVPFVWRDWIKQVTHKRDLQSTTWPRIIRKNNFDKPTDVDSLASFYANEGHSWMKGKRAINWQSHRASETTETWNTLCEPFRRLLRDTTGVMQPVETIASSFPLLSESKAALTNLRRDSDFESFCETTLGYLTGHRSKNESDMTDEGDQILNDFKKKYRKCLRSYKKYDMNSYFYAYDIDVLSNLKYPLSQSFYHFLRLMANIVEMTPNSVYKEFHMIENMLFRKDYDLRTRNRLERFW